MRQARAIQAAGLAGLEWPAEASGPVLVLLHGLGGNARIWQALAEALPERPLLAVDLPGHGLSPEPAGWDEAEPRSAVWEPGPIGRELAAQIQGPVVWIGHSWGGKVAVAAAAAAPESRGLVLLDAVPAPSAPLRRPERTADQLFGAEYGPWPSLEDAVAAVRDLPQYSPWSPALAEAFARGQQIADNGGVRPRLSRAKACAALEAMFAAELSPEAESLNIPVLALEAGEGFGMGAPHVQLYRNGTQQVLAGNHWLQVCNPGGLAEALRAWLAGQAL